MVFQSASLLFLQRSGEGREEVLEEDRVGKREKKIGGVPYFIVDSRWTLSGAQVQSEQSSRKTPWSYQESHFGVVIPKPPESQGEARNCEI